MKYIKYILVIVVVIFMVYVLVHPKTEPVVPVTSDTNTSEGEFCYIWNTEAGDKATLRMTLAKDASVTGSFAFLPAEKDSKKGPLTGTVAAPDANGVQIANLVWQASAEGMTTAEEFKIQIDATTAKPGFGEMKDRGDGTYVYADPTHISYNPTLQQTDCADLAVSTN